MKKCRGCESAADLAHFSSSAIKAAEPLRSAPASNCAERKGVEWRAPPGQPAPRPRTLMRVNSSVSSATNMHHAAASHMPREATLSVHTQCRPENTLPTGRTETLKGTFLLRLHILEHAKFRCMLHTEFSEGGGGARLRLVL
ncbi:hypothetical protein VZT92_004392 [Zoarces viviparus]|uniref:Uncharacterized protein n=1 Tax=Zoarces viviparus TaxID=48416 RepID=A0AAW1FYY3_ZOAVI